MPKSYRFRELNCTSYKILKEIKFDKTKFKMANSKIKYNPNRNRFVNAFAFIFERILLSVCFCVYLCNHN